MLNKFFSKKFKVNKTNIFLFSFLLTQIAVPTFELFKPSNANGTVLGGAASASGNGSLAIGASATADNDPLFSSFGDSFPATAVGAHANADSVSWGGETAIGSHTNAKGGGATAIGLHANTFGTNTIAIGSGASASGGGATALGSGANASYDFSTALGWGANASHFESTAIGYEAVTDKANQIVLGRDVDTVTVKGDLVVGVDGEYTLITREGITVNGVPLITEKANGEIHIGKNSLITTNEEKTLPNGKKVQPLYAKDDGGNLIPIDVRTKLLINGRDVEQSINNVGAMTAALTGLPTVPVDTNLACGVGTGTHGGDFAFSGGCASKVNENLSVNYAASMIMPSQDFAGDFEDQFSARAGFVWKLGKSNEPTKISLNESKELKKEVQDLKAKNDAIISQNAKLLARLEKLENIAFTLQKNEGLKLSKGL